MQAMILAGKIMALLDGRYNVAYDDIREAAIPAMRHRLILNFEAQAEGVTTDALIAPADAEVRGLDIVRAARAGRVCFHLLQPRNA